MEEEELQRQKQNFARKQRILGRPSISAPLFCPPSTKGESEEGTSLFHELAKAAVEEKMREVVRKQKSPSIRSNLLWYQRKQQGMTEGFHGEGFKYNLRTRKGAQFQIDPDTLPVLNESPPKPQSSSIDSGEEKPQSQIETEPPSPMEEIEDKAGVCVYNPSSTPASDLPPGCHYASKMIRGRLFWYVKEGVPYDEGDEGDSDERVLECLDISSMPSSRDDDDVASSKDSTTPFVPDSNPPVSQQLPVGSAAQSVSPPTSHAADFSAQPLKKRYRHVSNFVPTEEKEATPE